MSVNKSEIKKNIHDICNGCIDGYTSNTITRTKKYINVMAKQSSIGKEFEFKPENEEAILKMIDEWQFKPKSEVAVYVGSILNNDNKCELCGQTNKRMYFISNSLNGNILQVGSQCIKKFNFDSVIGGEFVTVDKALEFADNCFDETSDNVLSHPYCEILNECHKNNLAILKYTNNKNNDNMKFYIHYMMLYAIACYSFIKEINDNKEPDKELKIEVMNIQQKLIEWSQKNNYSGNITFVPGIQFVIDNSLPYTAKFKFILNYLTSYYFKTKAEGKKSFNMFTVMKEIFEKTKKITSIHVGNFKYEIFPFFEDYITHDKPIKYNLLALMLTLPNDKNECEEIMANFFRFKRKNKMALEINKKFEEYVNKFYNHIIEKGTTDEFSKFIIMLHNCCETALHALNEDIESTINKPRKTSNRHRTRNNLI